MRFLEGTLEIPQIPQAKTKADLRCNSQLELPVDLTRWTFNRHNIEIYEEPMPRTKKIPHRSLEFEAGKNGIVHENS